MSASHNTTPPLVLFGSKWALVKCQCVQGPNFIGALRFNRRVDPVTHRIWQITCDGCGCAGPWSPTQEDACAAWNRLQAPLDGPGKPG